MFAGIMGGWGASLHHTLFAHHKSRSPRFCGARYQFNLKRELVDMRYNVIYNAGHSYGGEGGRHNVVNNYYKRGASNFCNPSQPNPSETDNEFYEKYAKRCADKGAEMLILGATPELRDMALRKKNI